MKIKLKRPLFTPKGYFEAGVSDKFPEAMAPHLPSDALVWSDEAGAFVAPVRPDEQKPEDEKPKRGRRPKEEGPGMDEPDEQKPE